MKIGQEIEKKVINILENSENPISTTDLCLKIGRAWHSVNTHCLRLQLAGKINGFRVGKMNLWMKKGK